MTTVATVIETLSHSKVAMLSKCPRQFYYRYILGYKIPPNAFRNFGGAYHKTLEANFKHKVESGNDMSIEQVKDIFTDEWKSASAEVEWSYEEERKESFSNRGVDLVGTYVKDIAPNRNPSHVEYEFKVSLPEIDRPFVGVIDLVLQENYMSDHKTSTRRWPKDRANNEFNKAEDLFSQLRSNLKSYDPLMNNVLARRMLLKTFLEDSISLARYAHADLLKFQKKYSLAAEEFNELSLNNKNMCAQAGINASKLYSQLGNYEQSKTILIRLKNDVPQDKDMDEIIFLLAESEENLKNLSSALDLYHQLLTQYPNSLLVHKAREKARLLNIERNKESS